MLGRSITLVGKIADIVRLEHSRSGNPRFRIEFTNGDWFNTKPDASINYEVTNFKVGQEVECVLNGRNHIADMQLLSD